MLLCTKCNTEKDEDAFYACGKTSRPGGYTYWCKACYAQNYADNRERQLESNARARVKRQYGLTLEAYHALKANGCVVCRSTCRVHIDHCHKTGHVRGALCQECNQALGHTKDDPERLEALAAYLREDHNISQGLISQSH